MTLTPTLRLTEPTPLGDDGVWATYLNNDLVYTDLGINGILSKSIAGLTTYTLVADGSASDEARYQAYSFTGALAANCTVTIPANAKIGLVRNATTGGFNVILSTGTPGTMTIPPNNYWYQLLTTGTGIGAFKLGVTGDMIVAGTVSVGGLSISGPISGTDVTASGTLSVAGASSLKAVSATNITASGTGAFTGTLTAADGTTLDQVVNNSQFERVVQTVNGGSMAQVFPGGNMIQTGQKITLTGSDAITFPLEFALVSAILVSSNGNVGANVEARYGTTTGFTIISTSSGVGTSASWIATGTRF